MAWVNPATLVTGNSVTAAIWNANFSNMADTGWLPIPTYTNSWVSNAGPASGLTVAGYRIIGNRVQLGGSIKSGAVGTAAFTMPVGARPLIQVNPVSMTIVAANVLVSMGLAASGICTPSGYASGTVPSLDPISYYID